MLKNIISVIFFALLLSGILQISFNVQIISQVKSSTYTPHSPIHIYSNSGFTPENGVTGGSGTAIDPYIIEGWEINPSPDIIIKNTDVYFVIRDCRMPGHDDENPNIWLENVVNGRIENNWFLPARPLSAVYGSASEIEIVNNHMDGGFHYAVVSLSGDNNKVLNNELTDFWQGTGFLLTGDNNLVAHNRIPKTGNWLYPAIDILGEGNIIYDNVIVGSVQNAGNNQWNVAKTVGTNIVGGPYLGGNYYDDYQGVDGDGDGLGDTPYVIDSTNVDNYPLIAQNDLSIVSIEPIQVVAEAEALIKDKDTAVRVDVQNTFAQSKNIKIDVTYNFGFGAYTEAGKYRDGLEIRPGLNRIYLPGGPIYDKQGNDWVERTFPDGTTWWTPRDPDGKSLGDDFFFRWTAQTGADDNIKVVLDPDNKIVETMENNNEKTVTPGMKVAETDSLRVLVVPVYFPLVGQESFNPDLDAQQSFLQDIFPLSESSLDWVEGPAIPHFDIPITVPYLFDIWIYSRVCLPAEAVARLFDYDRIVLVTNGFPNEVTMWDGQAIGMLPFGDQCPIVVRNEALLTEPLIAHELGHTFYLWHPDRQQPEQPHGPDIANAEIFRVSQRHYEDTVDNLMTRWLPNIVWVDKLRYDSDTKQPIELNPLVKTYRWNLYDQLHTGVDPEILIVSGTIFQNGTFQNENPWYKTNGFPTLSSDGSGNYSVVLLDSESQILDRFSFNATFSYMAYVNGTLQEIETGMTPFIFNIPFLPGTVSIEIRDIADQVLTNRPITPNAPTVSVGYPNGEEILGAGNHVVFWTAVDQDGDNLTYTIAYSKDGGNNWVPLAVNLNQTSYSWNTSGLESGTDYLIKIIATDGVNTGEDTSDIAFTLDPKSPVVTVASPQAKTYYSDSVPVSIRADEDLSLSSIWYSLDNQPNVTTDENGFIDVPDGPHQIVFFANDTAGNVGSSNIVSFNVNSSVYYPWQTSFIGSGGYPITDLAEYDGQLYAARDTALYRYDGSSWTPVEAPTHALTLEYHDEMLYIGGKGGLYAFDGSDFYLILGVPNYIKILGVYNNTLYAGTFLDNPPKLYYCNGSADNPDNWHVDTDFSTLLNFSGPFGSIDSFVVYNDIMYLGSGGTLYSFDGTSWNIVETFEDVYAFSSMGVYNGKLYLATRDQGWRKPAYEGYSGFNGRVFEFDGSNWTEVFEHDYWIFSLEVYDGKLYAGTANKIYAFSGTDWTVSFDAAQEGFYAIAMKVYADKIYAGMGNGYVFADPVPIEADSRTATIPEFSSATTLAVFMVLTLLAVALIKKNRTRKFR